jgi:3-deoxy-manno-octulosonate cytidylyltransferase (CMP-KDO synthetase)
MKTICVIPARLKSSRFPEKILENILEKPMLVWVYEAASKVKAFDKVVFAIDSEKTARLLEAHNLPYHMTPDTLNSGTDRLSFLCTNGLEKADLWVNWQADEPLITEKMIMDLLSGVKNCPDADVYTLKKYLEKEEEIFSQHICKVVANKDGTALYFSRSPIPANRDGNWDFKKLFKHVGLYAYPQKTLMGLTQLEACPFEDDEKLEQLRFLYNGLKVHLEITDQVAFGIDLQEHIAMCENLIKEMEVSLN